MLTVILPAHNEADRLPACLDGLHAQTRPPDRIVVLADNCTDSTADVAAGLGADVFVPQRNRLAKAGAINQWLAGNLDSMGGGDWLMVVDADGVLDPDFIENAIRWWKRGYAAVGGVFRAESTARSSAGVRPTSTNATATCCADPVAAHWFSPGRPPCSPPDWPGRSSTADAPAGSPRAG